MRVLGGARWKESQRYKDVCALIGEGEDNLRTFRGLVAAFGELEMALISAIRSLMSDSQKWSAVPAHCRSVKLRNQAFKSLAMTLCLATELNDYHQGYPFKIFLLLLRPDDCALIDDIKRERERVMYGAIGLQML